MISDEPSPLQRAREAVAVLRRYGIRPEDHHLHVDENGTRCEFCGKPVQSAVHDPLRLRKGEK
jgi:hypothetical protein